MAAVTFEECQNTIASQSADVLTFIQSLQQLTQDEDWKPETGISLLEVKNHQMLEYLINLAVVMLAKLKGESIVGNPAIDRLVELRTVIERIKPIEQKMQYQIEKLLSSAVAGDSKDDSSKHKARPQDLVDEDESSGEESDEDGEGLKKKKPKKYQPPKLLAVPYGDEEAGENSKGREERDEFRLKKSMMEELQQQYSTAPEEIYDANEQRRRREEEKRRKRVEYEEENFVRLQMGKKQANAERKQKAVNSLDSLLDLGSFDSKKPNRKSGGSAQGGKKKKFSTNKKRTPRKK